MMSEVNWDFIREEFETTSAMLQELADKYNISPENIRSGNSQDGWDESRPKWIFFAPFRPFLLFGRSNFLLDKRGGRL